jgi:organic radical activating enzyme
METSINPKRIIGPHTICISLTNRCNVKCPGCLAFKDKGRELDPGQLHNIFSIFRGYDVKRVALAGGEPLLRKDIHRIVKDASEQGLQTALCTNGTLLNEDGIREFNDLLTEVIIPYHSTDPRIASQLTPFANAAHLKRMEKLFSFISGHTSIQLKPQTILAKINASVEEMTATGERLADCGAQLWKIDEYYDVDKSPELARRFCISHQEYPFVKDVLARIFAERIKVVGIGGSIRFQTTGFVVSPVGHAYINVPGPAEKKILGDMITEHERLFLHYNGEVLIPSDYDVLPKHHRDEKPASCLNYYPLNEFQDKTTEWAQDLIHLSDLKPKDQVMMVDPGFSAEFIGECIRWGINVTAFESSNNDLLRRLIERHVKEYGIDNSALLGGYELRDEPFGSNEGSVADMVLMVHSDPDASLRSVVHKFIRSLYAAKEGGKIAYIAPAGVFNGTTPVLYNVLQQLGITDNGYIGASLWRPFLATFGFTRIFKINAKGKLSGLSSDKVNDVAEEVLAKLNISNQ